MGKVKHEEMQNALKKIREEEQQKLYNKAAEDAAIRRQLERNIQYEELKKKGFVNRGNGKVTLWDEVLEAAEKTINAEVMSYNDWRAAMMGLLTLYGAFVKAAHHSIDASFIQFARAKVIDGCALPLKDAALDFLAGRPDVKLPALQHHVDLSEDGTLKFDLTRSDNVDNLGSTVDEVSGKPVEAVLNVLFRKGVDSWLEEQGYTKTAANTYVDRNGVGLTKERFATLKNDPDTGLGKYLNLNSDLQFAEVASPKMRSR